LGQKISDSVTAWRAAFASRAPAEAFVDVDNFERFVVTLPASTSSSDPGVARSVSAVTSKLAEAFAARAQAAKAIMLQSPGRYAALTQWLEKTERQAMLRLVLAARKSGLSCGGGSDSGSCGTLRRVAFEVLLEPYKNSKTKSAWSLRTVLRCLHKHSNLFSGLVYPSSKRRGPLAEQVPLVQLRSPKAV
jgi:hypothetical protein